MAHEDIMLIRDAISAGFLGLGIVIAASSFLLWHAIRTSAKRGAP